MIILMKRNFEHVESKFLHDAMALKYNLNLIIVFFKKNWILGLKHADKRVLGYLLETDYFFLTVPVTKGVYVVFKRVNYVLHNANVLLHVQMYINLYTGDFQPCFYFERDGNCMKHSQHYQWVCGITSTHFPDGLTVILENSKIRGFFFLKLRKVKHFKICDLQACSVIITE